MTKPTVQQAPIDDSDLDLEKEIAEIRAAREAFEAECNEERKALYAQANLRKEKYGLENDRALIAAEKEHGAVGIKIGMVTTPDGRGIIVRSPTIFEVKTIQAKKREPTDEEMEVYAAKCVVFPAKKELNAIMKEFPLTWASVYELMRDLGGNSAEARVGKSKS
jgi:hypothetical protein